jgi:uncharacterized protein (TIGR02118 family)
MIALKSTAIAASLLFSSAALAAEAKITVLYAQPNSAEEFDKHYFEKHEPMLHAIKEVKRVEISRPGSGPNGAAPSYHLVTEIYFDRTETLGMPRSEPRKNVPVKHACRRFGHNPLIQSYPLTLTSFG